LAELDLTGRVGFVTGGTRGIGLATARLLAAHGAQVVIAGTDEQRTREAADMFGGRGVACDSREPDQISAAYRTIRAEFGRLDFLVNNAGVLQDALVGMISPEMIDDVLGVNTKGPILHMQAASRLMRRSGGSIVNVSSIIGMRGNAGQVVYAASKAAIIGLTASAAKELAPRSIRVNAVAPGFIETDMTAALDPEKFSERMDSIAMGRIGTPQDVAGAVLFLVSDLSSYVTGQVLGVDGGMLV
jgi:3-oxoacyl-[acyl-carrier protein] reductase